MTPFLIEISLPVPVGMSVRFSHGRMIRNKIQRPVLATAYGLRRCPQRDYRGNEYQVYALAKISPMDRSYVKRDQWETDELAWVPALFALNAESLKSFLESGDQEWRVESAQA